MKQMVTMWGDGDLINLTTVIITHVYIYQFLNLYILNMFTSICPLYVNSWNWKKNVTILMVSLCFKKMFLFIMNMNPNVWMDIREPNATDI